MADLADDKRGELVERLRNRAAAASLDAQRQERIGHPVRARQIRECDEVPLLEAADALSARPGLSEEDRERLLLALDVGANADGSVTLDAVEAAFLRKLAEGSSHG